MAISTSKTINRIASRKKWRENGIRDLDFESNPHSNGDNFSLDDFGVYCIIIVPILITRGIKIEGIIRISGFIIMEMFYVRCLRPMH